ncbi:MAG TPA: hypothetical protein VGF79_04240, partial [Bacteroidia bacterium]
MKRLFPLLIICFCWLEAGATHMMGGDIAYECISPGKYKLVIKIYRDCRGIPFNNPSIAVFCADGSNSVNVNYTRTAINDITEVCPTDPGPCVPTNTPTGAGIEEHVFEAIIDFNSNPFKAIKDANCCEVKIKVEQNARNSAISTMTAGNFYTDAMINICKIGDKCNTSPQLSTPPVAYLCCNQSFTFNNGVREVIDGDSLSYNLDNPLNANNSNEVFNAPFTYKNPMTPYCPPNPGVITCGCKPNAKPPRGFCFDELTGDIIFTPTKCDEVGVIVIRIDEWRKNPNTKKWELIGYTKRDMQLIVRQCADNNPPYFTGINKYSICEGSNICFDVVSKDDPFLPKQTVPDTLVLTWNYGIPGASFTIVDATAREKTAKFCWQTKIGDARPNAYSFTATVKDNNCDNPAQANRGYNITVKPKARDTRDYDILNCGWLKFEALPSDTVNLLEQYYTYKYTIRDSTNTGAPLYMTYSRLDSFKFKRGGKYIIEHEVNYPQYNCPTKYSDTIIMPPILDVELAFGKDTFVCAGNSLTVKPNIANGIPRYQYAWESPRGTKNPQDSLDQFTLVKPKQDTEIILKLIDKNNCIDMDTIKVAYKLNPTVNIGPDKRICTYESIELDAQNDDTLKYYWQPNGDSTRKITVNIAGKYIAKVIDKLGCNASDTMELFVNDTVIASAGPDREICIQDTLKVNGVRTPKGYPRSIIWKDLNTGGTVATDSSFKLKMTSSVKRNYEMTLKVNQSDVVCTDIDTFELLVNKLPTFIFAGLPPRCYADGAINLTQNNIATGVSGDGKEKEKDLIYYQKKKPSWIRYGQTNPLKSPCVYDYPNFITNEQVPKAGLRDTICYEYRDYKGCYNYECKPIKLNPNPAVKLKDGVFCQKAGPINLENLIETPIASQRASGIQNFKCIEVPNGSGVDPDAIITSSGFPPIPYMNPGIEGENEKTGIYKIQYCYKDAVSGCQTCDTATINVIKLPVIKFDYLPQQCINFALLALDSFVREENSGMRFSGSKWTTVEFNGSRDKNIPMTKQRLENSIQNDRYFNPKTGAGKYMLKMEDNSSGCPVSDSTEILVNGLPLIQINVPDTVCSSSAAFELNNILPSGSVGTWSGPGVVGRNFDPAYSPKINTYEGAYMLKYAYTNPLTGCTSSDSQSLLVQSQPEVVIQTPGVYQLCEGQPFDVVATKNFVANTTWSSDGDGDFGNTTKLLIARYRHGINDTALNGKNGDVMLRISTDKEGVCPIAYDELPLKIQPYPIISFYSPDTLQCEPAKVTFTALVSKPAGSSNLRYSWWYGNGDSIIRSTSAVQPNIPYDTANRNWYDVKLRVENVWGAGATETCPSEKFVADYVKVIPQPKAGFSSDPGFFTTVAFPKFKFFNETKYRWINPASMKYTWHFGTDDEDDTSTQVNPIHTYSNDTMKYWVHLTSEISYGGLTCWDTFGQLRKIGPDVTVFVPTAFSPEGTGPGTNNVFRPVVNGEKTYHIELFNRWGEILWKS